jgi:ADP-heptose:LPS heptosyltransferase
MTFPALTAIVREFPQASLSLLTEFDDGPFDLFPDVGALDRIYRYDPSGFHKSLRSKLIFFRGVGRDGFDLIINANRGNILVESSLMAFLIGTPFRAGYVRDHIGYLNNLRIEFADDRYIAEQNGGLIEFIGLRTIGSKIPLEIDSDCDLEVLGVLEKEGIKKGAPFIIIHPGGKYHRHIKQWPVENYADLVRWILDSAQVGVLVVGSKDEKAMADAIIGEGIGKGAVNLTGKTTIAQLAALISMAGLFIGNDSGPLHIAVALNRPCIAIFGGTSPLQLLPADRDHIQVITGSAGASYLHQPHYRSISDAGPIEDISVEKVIEAFNKWLKGGGPHGTGPPDGAD